MLMAYLGFLWHSDLHVLRHTVGAPSSKNPQKIIMTRVRFLRLLQRWYALFQRVPLEPLCAPSRVKLNCP